MFCPFWPNWMLWCTLWPLSGSTNLAGVSGRRYGPFSLAKGSGGAKEDSGIAGCEEERWKVLEAWIWSKARFMVWGEMGAKCDLHKKLRVRAASKRVCWVQDISHLV